MIPPKSLVTEDSLPSYSKGALIYNPYAGGLRKNPGKIELISSALETLGMDLQLIPTRAPGDGTTQARNLIQSNCQVILACGGDGTINEIIGGMAGSSVPLMVIPAGTANVLANEIGMPRDPEKCAQLLRTGVSRRISLGKAGARYFALMAGVGVDAGVVAAVDPGVKDKLGQGAFWLAGFQQLGRYHFLPFEIRVDGHPYSCTFALLSKTQRYASRFRITPEASLFSDAFEICLFQSTNRWRYLIYLLFVMLRKHGHLSDVTRIQGKEIEAVGPGQITVQVDGELIGTLPQQFHIQSDALTLIMPRNSAR
ncbi:MAG: diacylglycerol kinase family protein [Terriglobia bacterium]